MMRNKRLILAACGLGLATTLVGAGVASADPSGTPPANTNQRYLQGTGSDTTEEVMNGMSDVIISDGSTGLPPAGDKLISSWNATGGAFQSRASGCSYTANAGTGYVEGTRPNGSGQGVSALKDAFTPAKPTFGCLDFARSSGNGSGTNTPQLTYIPFAKDAVAFAVSATSTISRTLTLADVKAMYNCSYPGFTGPTPAKKALLPQSGSGTRGFWLTAMGLTEATINSTTYPCLSDRTDFDRLQKSNPGGTAIQEHRGNVLKNNQIIPISAGQFIAQSQGAATDFRGFSVLGTVTDGGSAVSYPVGLNTSYGTVSTTPALNAAFTRDVYNVVPTSTVSDPDVDYVFTDTDGSGSADTSEICKNSAVILRFGFGVISNCGAIAGVF